MARILLVEGNEMNQAPWRRRLDRIARLIGQPAGGAP